MQEEGVRVHLDDRKETLDKRIRYAEVNKIPYTLILGRKEAQSSTVSVRRKGKGDQGACALEEFLKQILRQIREYK